MTQKPLSAFLAPRSNIDFVYGEERAREIETRTTLIEPYPVVEPDDWRTTIGAGSEIEVLFSTWGMPAINEKDLGEFFPRLKAVFYAAGSVQLFARPLLQRDVTLVSAWRANAVSVAQFTVAQTMLALKGYFRNIRQYDGSPSTYESAFRGAGAYREAVGLLGAGAIGSLVIENLIAQDVTVLVWDPFLDPCAAKRMGAIQVESIEELFQRSYVVSNHLANNDQTAGLITGELMRQMRRDATFINTGRGRTVNEAEMIETLRERPDLLALLDVTFPEPMGADSRLRSLPNVIVSSHIAGTIGNEVHRMADLCIGEFDRFASGQPLEHQVTIDLLRTMA
ncbi:MAG: hydroxyacid dehydrogenase [Capsulimonadaceae bacterium]|nr:hydroxyacid dehydrogenase [Capsulimonadaceae bacterium]